MIYETWYLSDEIYTNVMRPKNINNKKNWRYIIQTILYLSNIWWYIKIENHAENICCHAPRKCLSRITATNTGTRKQSTKKKPNKYLSMALMTTAQVTWSLLTSQSERLFDEVFLINSTSPVSLVLLLLSKPSFKVLNSISSSSGFIAYVFSRR